MGQYLRNLIILTQRKCAYQYYVGTTKDYTLVRRNSEKQQCRHNLFTTVILFSFYGAKVKPIGQFLLGQFGQTALAQNNNVCWVITNGKCTQLWTSGNDRQGGVLLNQIYSYNLPVAVSMRHGNKVD